MADFLTDRALFKCGSSPLVKIGATMSGNATYRHATVLTASAMLAPKSPAMKCEPLSASAGGTFMPCSLGMPATAILTTGLDYKHTVANMPMLTSACRGVCPFGGGIISVAFNGDTKALFCQGFTDAAQRGADGSGDSGHADSAGNKKEEHGRDNRDAERKSPQQDKTGDRDTDQVTAANNIGTDRENIAAESGESGIAAEKIPNPEDSPALKCRKCAMADTCETRAQFAGIAFENNSRILKENYDRRMTGKQEELPEWYQDWLTSQNKEKDAKAGKKLILPPASSVQPSHKAHQSYLAAEKARTQYEGAHPDRLSWGYEAHHILSGNEVVAEVPDVLALVKALGYDINNADNCIMLPALDRTRNNALEEKFGKWQATRKHTHKFEIMAITRLQWHGSKHGKTGGANFSEELAAKIREGMRVRHCENQPVDYYAELLKRRLEEEIADKYIADPVCPRQDFERRKKFYEQMNSIAEEVRKKLASFAEKPHHSVPWYVSVEAWIYAFNLPRTRRLIVVTPAQDGLLRLEKFRLTRYADTMEENQKARSLDRRHKRLTIEPWQNRGGEPQILWRPGSAGIMECVNFCGNVALFAFAPGLSGQCLGFTVPEKLIFRLNTRHVLAKSALPELEKRQSELLVWVWERDDVPEAAECRSKVERKRQAQAWFANGGA